VPNRDLTRLFLQRFVENDLISPDADRARALAQACGALISGGLFVSLLLSIPYLDTPYPMPGRTAAGMIRVQFLCAAWSMTVMALLAVSVWDALSLDSRDTEVLGPLPLPSGVIVRAKVAALFAFAAVFVAALNVLPGLIHPVAAIGRLRPTTLQVGTLMASHMASTSAAAAFGFAAVLGVREMLHALLGPAGFRRVSVVVRGAFVVMLVTTLLLIPAMSFKIANLWLQGAIDATYLPPMWFAGLHDILSGHIWAQLPRPDLPPSVSMSARAFEFLYESRRPLLRELGLAGGGAFLILLLVTAAAYRWNNRHLPDPPAWRTAERGPAGTFFDALARRLLARPAVVSAGFFFTMRVLARSVQNRLSIAVALALAIAIATVSLRLAGMNESMDFASAPVALLAVQLLCIAAVATGFRHAIRVPADLRARWLFHLIRPANHDAYLTGVTRAAGVRLVIPVLLALLPLHVVALGAPTAFLHFGYGLMFAAVVGEASLLGYRRLPFASSYVPTIDFTTYGTVYGFLLLLAVYSVAWLEYIALRSTTSVVVLFALTTIVLVGIRVLDAWQRRDRQEVELDELVEAPTLRLGLSD
jgi:hypothetical protein